MKIETNKKSGFEPIELKITIESLAELKMMALRMNEDAVNLSTYDQVKLSPKEIKEVADAEMTLFAFFDKKLIDLGISTDL
jgi:hypothetical protein